MIFFWALLYGLAYGFSGWLSSLWHIPWLTPLAMSLYTFFLILWIQNTGRADTFGLTMPQPRKASPLLLFPLLLLPLCNLLLTKPVFPSLSTLLLVLSSCTAEELFFRGYLFRALQKQLGAVSAFIVSALFALFHLSNLISGWPPGYVALQMLAAFSAGLCLCAARLHFGSLLPCIAVHFLTNITAGDAPSLFLSGSRIIWIVCILLQLFCGFLQYYKFSLNTEDYS